MDRMGRNTNQIVAPFTGTSAHDDVVMLPISNEQLRSPEVHGTGTSPQFYLPLLLLWARASQPIRNKLRIVSQENSDHVVVTIPELPVCRVCEFDEEEEDHDVLVELGCSCKGHLGRMHRKCILRWYGVRMLLEKNFKCEVCKTVLHPELQLTVVRGVSDHRNGGRALLMNALKSSLASYAPHVEVERAATYQELVVLLLQETVDLWRLRLQPEVTVQAESSFANNFGRGASVRLIGVTVLLGGLIALLLHFFGG